VKRLTPTKTKPRDIARAAELLRAGRLVAFPTETVYGLGANALDEAAVRRIFEAKGRPHSSPLIVHVASIEMARGLAREWPEKAETLARRFWPGPLTIVVPKNASVPDVVTAGLPSVGLRMPAHPIARALLEAAQIPIAAPSANRFTELSPTRAEHVRPELAEMILDGGQCTVGIESTVVSLGFLDRNLDNDSTPKILRPGMISQTQIEDAIGPVEVGAGAESPGQHPRHYSPRTPVVLGDAPQQGRGIRLDFNVMPTEPAEYAERLYSILHDLDQEGYDWIAVEMPPDTPDWAGIRDRLKRAAHRE
jgi:L-threonylcarbamoyladenylate synthase